MGRQTAQQGGSGSYHGHGRPRSPEERLKAPYSESTHVDRGSTADPCRIQVRRAEHSSSQARIGIADRLTGCARVFARTSSERARLAVRGLAGQDLSAVFDPPGAAACIL